MEGKTNSFESLGKWDPSVYFASPARRIAFILPSFSSLFLVRPSIDISRFFAALCSLCLISVKILLRDRIPFNIKKLKSVETRTMNLKNVFSMERSNYLIAGQTIFQTRERKLKVIWEKFGSLRTEFLDFEYFERKKPPVIFQPTITNDVITRATFSTNNSIFHNEF